MKFDYFPIVCAAYLVAVAARAVGPIGKAIGRVVPAARC